MSDFQLDTSGAVALPSTHLGVEVPATNWLDLDAFTQGYVEALFREHHGSGYRKAAIAAGGLLVYEEMVLDGAPIPEDCAFSDLAPETLATIIRRCAYGIGLYVGEPGATEGADFYARQQRGELLRFPRSAHITRLTPTLGDDGKVRFQ